MIILQIVIIDDDCNQAKTLSDILTFHNLPNIFKNNPLDVLDIKHIDILITDIMMPKLNGIELAKKCLKINPDLLTIFISAYSSLTLDQDAVLFIKPLISGQMEKLIKILKSKV